ncbi:MAG: hypothetical protein L6V95_02550 [Candidatus Melainabacteria bacterium]|nr:MAG: hypothetical protein L6V95_02550 [Candidatus Melainabacteria bacterium]
MSKKNKHQHHGENPFKENENINSEENTTEEETKTLKKTMKQTQKLHKKTIIKLNMKP